MISAWRLISILLAATAALAVYEIQSDMYQRGRDGEHLTERARASIFGRMSFQVLRAFKQLQRQTQDAGPLFKKPRVDEEEEDDVKEEVDGRQKLRIKATGRIARVVKFQAQGYLRVELDGPELELITTRTTLVTFLDAAGNEMDKDAVRKPYPAQNIGRGPRGKLVKDIGRWAGAYDEATPLTESDIKAKVVDWSKIDASNVLEIKVEDAPEMDVSQDVFAKCGKGGYSERAGVRNYLLDLRFLREKNHKDTLKKTHHLEKGIDDLYDAETNSFRYEFREWFAGSGRYSIWRAVSKKIKEVDAPRCPHTNTLSSADVHRDECPTEFFHDEEFEEKLRTRSIEGLEGEETDRAPREHVSLNDEEGFEGVGGYVHMSNGRLYYLWTFWVRGQGSQTSDVFYNTKEEARDARTEAIHNYNWPPLADNWMDGDEAKKKYIDYGPFWEVIRDNDDVMNPWDVRFGSDYAEYDNSDFRYHCTSAYNWERHSEIIMTFGLDMKALCDDPTSGVPHSRCGELLWACATLRDCFRHCRSPMTVNRHVLNGINTYDKWNDVVILALPKEGWQKKATPEYRFSGAYSQGPITPVACLRRDLTEGKEGLDETRIWAAAGHPDVSDSC